MASGVTVVADVETISLTAMEAAIGSDFHGTVIHFGSVGQDADAEFIRNDGTPSGLNVATIAAFHEFGAGDLEVRSTVGMWTDMNKRGIGDTYREGVEDLLDGTGNAKDVAGRIGAFSARGISDFIVGDSVRPELGDWWIGDPWRDQEGIPLFDTGQIAGSMSFEVDPS